MAPLTNGRLLFNSVPTGMAYMLSYGMIILLTVFLMRFFRYSGYPEPGKTTVYDTTEKIDLQNVVINGGILVKTLELSIDPYLRGRMREPEVKSNNVSCEELSQLCNP
jgi:hypothetical protein